MKKEMNDLQRYLVEEFVEDYQHGQMSRREALRYIAAVVGSLAAASTILAACAPATQPTATAQPPASPTMIAEPPTATPQPTLTSPPLATPTAAQPTTTIQPTSTLAATVALTATQIATQAVITTIATLAVQPTPEATPGVRVSPDDPAIVASDIEFAGRNATIIAYLARPRGDGSYPAVLVCHENRGLTEHIKDVTRRLAKAGYVSLAVDLLSRNGGTAKISDPAQIPGTLGNTPVEQMVQDFQDALAYLQSQPYMIKDQVGMTGFCFGGAITWRVATKTPSLKAAVPFYGSNPPLEDVPGIQAAVLAIYGENDQRINAGISAIEKAMQDNNKIFEKLIYPGAGHAFHNDTGGNYRPDAARDAWAKTLAWFDKYVKG
ncbi:MAG: dienelactone hydrolase family protein [Anaerolineae bacterium]|nr:dienelactone hydrolase family protein [Anaerolineae bacterium]